MLFLFHRTQLYLTPAADGTWLPLAAASFTPVADSLVFSLTTADGTPCQAARVVEAQMDKAKLWHLREAYGVMPRHLHALAGKAAELLHWDAHSQYCSTCGGRMERHTEISKVCTACGEEVWPQLQTAIIVLIVRDDKVLLVRARNFRRPFHGLVAGFVETGESLEECVRREVREETGIEINNLRYFDSQPWPYPIGLMVGFRAEYARGELRLLDGELAHADWYSADNLPELPPPPSIARRLIDQWVEERRKNSGVFY